MGASTLGDKCDRKVWYKFRWAGMDKDHTAQRLRLFNRGHREEPEFLRYLSAIPGVEVWAAGEDGPLKEAMRVHFADGHGGGTPDGVIRGLPEFPDEACLLEFKTMNDKSFQKTKEDGVMSAHYEYFIQMQVYLEGLDLPRALFMAVNKNDDEVHFEWVVRNPVNAQETMQRAHKLVFAYARTAPGRISESPGWWMCKWCDFMQLCHMKEIPNINCRTCQWSYPGPAGVWGCKRGCSEISTQPEDGCDQHVFAPYFFSHVRVERVDEQRNVIHLHDGVSADKWGPAHTTSHRLREIGFVPF